MTLPVTDLDASLDFYLKALEPLGYALVMDITREQYPQLPVERTCGLGADGKPDLWLKPVDSVTPTHIAFTAVDRATVDAFHAAALAAGGEDNGPPGPRPHYHEHYYGAFAIDPDGYNIEAVCQAVPG